MRNVKYLCINCGVVWDTEIEAEKCCLAQTLYDTAQDIWSVHFPKDVSRNFDNLGYFYYLRYKALSDIEDSLKKLGEYGLAEMVRKQGDEAWRKYRNYGKLSGIVKKGMENLFKGMMEDVEN